MKLDELWCQILNCELHFSLFTIQDLTPIFVARPPLTTFWIRLAALLRRPKRATINLSSSRRNWKTKGRPQVPGPKTAESS